MRCNVGINPAYLTDQWLVAEYRELPMVVGSLRLYKWKIKTEANAVFDLGKGHINWFKRRLVYLNRRHICVKEEMVKRGFKCDALSFTLEDYPIEFKGDWNPTMQDSSKIRDRLIQKLLNNENGRPISWWRWYGGHLMPETVNTYVDTLRNGELFPV